MSEGKEIADATIAESLYHRAKGYSHPEVHVSNYQGAVTLTPRDDVCAIRATSRKVRSTDNPTFSTIYFARASTAAFTSTFFNRRVPC